MYNCTHNLSNNKNYLSILIILILFFLERYYKKRKMKKNKIQNYLIIILKTIQNLNPIHF